MEKITCIFHSVISTINLSPFLSSLTSSLLVGIFLTFAIPYYLERLKKPKSLTFQFNKSNSDTISISKIGDKEYQYSFQLDLTHQSGKLFKEKIYWHLYIPKSLNPQFSQIDGYVTLFSKDDFSDGVHIHGKIEGPIYPYSVSTLSLIISGKFTTKEQLNQLSVPLYYFFETEFGHYPSKFNKLNPKLGIGTLETMFKLYLKHNE